jgi:hypothetical protein
MGIIAPPACHLLHAAAGAAGAGMATVMHLDEYLLLQELCCLGRGGVQVFALWCWRTVMGA